MKNYTRKHTGVFGDSYCDEYNGFHRTDGPAYEGRNGDKEWWVNDKQHRIDGPAVERPDGSEEWWVNDVQLRQSQFEKLQEIRRIFNDDELLNFLLFEGQITI